MGAAGERSAGLADYSAGGGTVAHPRATVQVGIGLGTARHRAGFGGTRGAGPTQGWHPAAAFVGSVGGAEGTAEERSDGLYGPAGPARLDPGDEQEDDR
ncbi:MAG: hypothetical protein KAJ19_16825 [Gammaproteobacteria bacterium]|nr:hypothetical protein [Gammaproteobacteria bacterium]